MSQPACPERVKGAGGFPPVARTLLAVESCPFSDATACFRSLNALKTGPTMLLLVLLFSRITSKISAIRASF
jgi:hypothetical protein